METYLEMKKRHQQEVNAFPIGCAFNMKQFDEMMNRFGLDPRDTRSIVSIDGGCFIRRKDKEAYLDLMSRIEHETMDAIFDKDNGGQFAYEMFLYELGNHEYCITMDPEDTLEACGIGMNTILEHRFLQNAFLRAEKDYLKSCKMEDEEE